MVIIFAKWVWLNVNESQEKLKEKKNKRKMGLVDYYYLEIFILEHYSGDVVGVLIENNGGVVEGRRRDDGGNGM